MKKKLILILLSLSFHQLIAQTNNFPTSGNVGLGTSNPTAKLTVDPIGHGGIVIGNTEAGGFTSLTLFISSLKDGYSTIQSVKSSGSSYGDICLNPIAGNVGIGTVNPTAKLSVKGKIRAQEVTVEANNWPDYVFHADYEIRPLSEVENYIRKNNHLPDIPSAKQINEYGIDLGDMNSRLLKKIEELTLYLLKKDKELKQEQKINCTQQNQIDYLTMQMKLLTKKKAN